MYKNKLRSKAILVANTSWYLYNFRFPLIKKLLSHGCEVIALAPQDSYVNKLRDSNVLHVDITITRSGLNPLVDIHLLLQFIKAYKKYRPDIVQHFTVKPVIYGTIAAHLCGVKHIFNMVPGMGYVFTGKSFKKFWVQKIVRFLYKRTTGYSSHVFFQNNDDRNFFLKHNIVDERKTSVVSGTGVDIDKFRPIKKKKKRGITFIMAARMLWDKGIGEYVDAARSVRSKYRDTHFWLLGPIDLQNPKGIKPKQLQQWNEEGIAEYLGMTDNIKSYLQKADVIVLPSYYREGIPLSLLEGAAMGMPIITTDSTGCRDVVEDGKNGFLVPIRNAAKLTAAMERFTNRPVLISRMGKESRIMAVKKFDSRLVVEEILKYYPL